MERNYFATFQEIKSLMLENLMLERQIQQLKNSDFEIIPKELSLETSMQNIGIYDKYFGCDVIYGKLLMENVKLKNQLKQIKT